MYIIFDTETTGLPKNFNAPYTDTDNWPRCVQIAWQLHDKYGKIIESKDFIIQPDGYDIPFQSEQIHGISTLLAQKEGESLEKVLDFFNESLKKAEFVIGQNVNFDLNVMGSEFVRLNKNNILHDLPVLDTCTEVTANLCKIPGGRGGRFKYPTLTELHQHLFQSPFKEAHNATADVEATARIFFELIRKRVFTPQELHTDAHYLDEFEKHNPDTIQPVGIAHKNLKKRSALLNQAHQPEEQISQKEIEKGIEQLTDTSFVHLHNHTQFSVLQSTISVKELIRKAADFNMPAVAITDIGNMMGAFIFEKEVSEYNRKIRSEREEKGDSFTKKEITPIIGCTLYVCEDHLNKTRQDNGYQVVFLAKNKKGYQNLAKMSSIAFTEGKYYVPRIDKRIVEQYKSDLIVLSGNLSGEIPDKILNVGEKQAEDALLWWKDQFGDDFYLELMRHDLEAERRVNETLLAFSKKHGVKIVATNDTYYADRDDAKIHDILLCIKNGEMLDTKIGQGRGFRYGLSNDSYYFKSPEEMKQLFVDLPEAITNTIEIANKCEKYHLASDVLLPAFEIPEEFQDPKDKEDGGKRGENNYLRHLTYEGAKSRYGEITDEIRERLDFELETIEKTGYPGYFLIVQDFCHAARNMGVDVGPGRGSAAGSAVAYCTRITNIDPIKYNLLFERFLNPERVSMPDIDIDFEDNGRNKVIKWVIDKYGSNQVAQIITYGTMAAKSSIRDTARVLDLPLSEADYLSKLIPSNISLKKIFNLNSEDLAKQLQSRQDGIAMVDQLIMLSKQKDLKANVIKNARRVEGNVRNTGIHACGVIITPSDITNFVPVALAKDSEMYCTQYDNNVVEEAGLLKMDFLGLKTLTLIKDAIQFVKENRNIELVSDDFPLDDEKTYELFQRGETIGIFQYESPGMQKYMRQLKPTTFADLIAMNALYRPGPMEYIPDFIKRKNGEQEITYDIEASKEYLEETYGITVYQEQVMLLSQKLADFTKGEADTLRKAMGKKKHSLLAKLKPKFLNQGAKKGHDTAKLEKIWHAWEAFASYAFNKSHSTCYAWIAYQTAYLKANYPAEYMASVLSNNMNDIKEVTFFMNECKRMGIKVLCPDINESNYKFTVNKKGEIRFGLGAIKGVGIAPIEEIVSERKENGEYKDIFDVTKRVNLKKCNKKAFEGLVLSGALDSFTDTHRAQYFVEENNQNFLSNAIKFGSNYQDGLNSNQMSMFGEESGVESPAPTIPEAAEWSTLQKLKKEKEVVGIYITGHPLDDYKVDIESFCNASVSDTNPNEKNINRQILFPAIITEVEHRHTRKGDPFGTILIEDYNDTKKLFLFREDYGRFKDYMIEGAYVYIEGKVQANRYKPKDFEFKISRIDFLSNLRKSLGKAIEICVELDEINPKFIKDCSEVFNAHKGDFPLSFKIIDPIKKIEIRMPSQSMNIDANDQLIEQLTNLNIDFKLVK